MEEMTPFSMSSLYKRRDCIGSWREHDLCGQHRHDDIDDKPYFRHVLRAIKREDLSMTSFIVIHNDGI